MHDMTEELYTLCETLEADLAKTNQKLEKSGGTMTGADLDYIDKLTHAMKSIKTVIAMTEAEDGYSGRGSYADGRGNRGGRYDGMTYARGGNVRRDSMGRYSREGGYSRAEDFREMLADAMESAPNESVKEKLRRMMNEV